MFLSPAREASMSRNRLTLLAVSLGLVTSLAVAVAVRPVSEARVGGGAVTEVQITGRFGIATNASAVAINLAAINPAGAGFLTAYPCGGTRPEASTVNHDTSAATSNSSIVKIGTGGKICIYSLAATDILVDVTGWFPANSGYTPITPDRALDTRNGLPPVIPTAAQFVQTFDGNTGMQTLERGVFHRNVGYQEAGQPQVTWGDGNAIHGANWTGDHDLACGSADTQRPLSSGPTNFNVDQIFYNCRDHMMTSVGDTDGYSVTWFTPDQVFNSVRSVAVDVNLTDLGTRQWLKIGVVSDALYNSTYAGAFPVGRVPGFLVSDVGSSSLDSDLAGPDRMIATWSGGASAGYPGALMIGNTKTGASFNAGTDKATRHPVTLTDNGNGTITFTAGPARATASGRFPACPCRVVFYDHDYTPTKSESGYPIGFTFHWDNIIVV
jgi:hypothetical protein